jgi:hypothetical protein
MRTDNDWHWNEDAISRSINGKSRIAIALQVFPSCLVLGVAWLYSSMQ